MLRGSVEGQGLTDGGELHGLLSFFFFFFGEIIKKQSVIISVGNCCGRFQRCFFCNDANTCCLHFHTVQKWYDLSISLCMNTLYKLMRK